MSKKLLAKTLKYYMVFSITMLIIAGIAFYFFGTLLYVNNADRELLILKKEFVSLSLPALKPDKIAAWNEFNRDLKIRDNDKQLAGDIFFYHSYYNCLSETYERYRVLHSPVSIQGKNYIFSAKINLIKDEALIIGIVRLFAIIGFLLLTGLFLITRFLSIRLWKPFYTTLQQMERFEIDKVIKPELPNVDIEEFERLNAAISRLMDKNTSIYASQSEFIENASHELQTPLAIFKGMLQTLQQRDDITKGQFEILENINVAACRLGKINKNLLLLSRLESRQFDITQGMTVNAVVEHQLPFFTEQAQARNLVIRYTSQAVLYVSANGVLLEIVINNLFNNAIRHNNREGEINIVVKEDSLCFSNSSGSGPLDEVRLFNRFTKASTSSQGSGLGLAIISRIATLNGWRFSYRFEEKQHFFRVDF
ncbi:MULTISPECIES: sensor histidine kinase [Flavobacterium]|nr:HAMP domain-containing sensor histidine kinase [Flavobacterium limi]